MVVDSVSGTISRLADQRQERSPSTSCAGLKARCQAWVRPSRHSLFGLAGSLDPRLPRPSSRGGRRTLSTTRWKMVSTGDPPRQRPSAVAGIGRASAPTLITRCWSRRPKSLENPPDGRWSARELARMWRAAKAAGPRSHQLCGLRPCGRWPQEQTSGRDAFVQELRREVQACSAAPSRAWATGRRPETMAARRARGPSTTGGLRRRAVDAAASSSPSCCRSLRWANISSANS